MRDARMDDETALPDLPDTLPELCDWIAERVQGVADEPDDERRERVFDLLDGIDALHRAALTRMTDMLQAPEHARLWHSIQSDSVVRTVLRLYDIVPDEEEEREQMLRALADTARTANAARGKPVVPLKLVAPPAPPVAAPAPHWQAVTIGELPQGTMRGERIAGEAVLLCNIAGELRAYHDACPDTPLAISVGQLDGDEIVCPWHGCRFDALTGARRVHRGTSLAAFPLEVQDGIIYVATNLPGSTLAVVAVAGERV